MRSWHGLTQLAWGTKRIVKTDEATGRSWGESTVFTVHEPRSGRRFCYDLTVAHPGLPDRRFEDLEDNSSRLKRIWHFIFRRFR